MPIYAVFSLCYFVSVLVTQTLNSLIYNNNVKNLNSIGFIAIDIINVQIKFRLSCVKSKTYGEGNTVMSYK